MLGKRVQIKMLGAFEVYYSHASLSEEIFLEITAAKLRQVLALLAANSGSVVGTDLLIDELWPSGPPNTVKTVVQTYVYQLRKLFARHLTCPKGAELLVTRPGGYLLAVPRSNVDFFQFEALAAAGKKDLSVGQEIRAAEILRHALSLWRGPMPSDITSGPTLRGLSDYLEEKRLEALSLRIDADLAGNRHAELVGELKSLVATYHLHESFHLQLMRALYESGRRSEALIAYQNLHRMLDDEMGLEPSMEAKKLQQEILISG